MLRRLDDAEGQLGEMGCAEVLADHDLGWTFLDEVDDWNVSITLRRAVERRGDMLLVPLECQGRVRLRLSSGRLRYLAWDGH